LKTAIKNKTPGVITLAYSGHYTDVRPCRTYLCYSIIALSFILTFNVQRHWIALTVTFLIATDTRVNTSAAPRHLLQDQTLIADNRAGGRVVVQQFSLCVSNTVLSMILLSIIFRLKRLVGTKHVRPYRCLCVMETIRVQQDFNNNIQYIALNEITG